MIPDISVIVPTRNRSQLLHRLLTQLFRIDDDLTYEIVVIDEGSTDGTPALLDELAAAHPLHVVRNDPPVGLSAARNAGAARSTGRYLAWIDDDDVTSLDRLRRQLQALQETGSRWSCAGRIDIDDDLRFVGHFRCPSVDDFAREILRMNILPTAGQGLLVERSLVDQLGGYDESLRSAEDWEYAIRLAQIEPPHLLDAPLVAYRTGVASMSTNTAVMEASIEAVIAKHAESYRRHQVEPDRAAIHSSLLAADVTVSRRRALSRAIKAARAAPSIRAWRRCVLVAIAPRWFSARSAARRAQQVPAAWAEQASWVADLPPLR